MNPSAIVFGSRGGIGGAVYDLLQQSQFRVHGVSRSEIDWNSHDSYHKAQWLLDQMRPDIVVNCAGIFQDGTQQSHHETFNVNVGSNWALIRYLDTHCRNRSLHLIMIGSSSHDGGRAAYPLYSASKAAVYNLWQSARDLFAGSSVMVSLVNPQRTRTKMNAAHYDPKLAYHEPQQVAEQVLAVIGGNSSICINMQLEKTQ